MITWEDVQQGIFDGESGGDYNALFGYQNRQNGIFSNVRITDMTVDEALAFADPKGEYARYVASKNNGQIATPMGAYQIVGRTLRDAKEKLNLSGDEKLTKSLQDRIGKWLYKTQGTKAWVGYKGPKETAEGAKNMNPLQMQQMQQMQQRQGGLMGFLRDPRTRVALGDMSRTSIGRRIADTARKEIATNKIKEVENATARYLDTQPNGKKYADAIRMGMPAKEILDQYRTDQGLGTDGNVQSSTALFGGGTMIVTRDGQFIVKDTNNKILKGQEAQDYIDAANAKKQKFDQENAAGKKLGQITAERADKVYEKAEKVTESIDNINRAIKALDDGAMSGFLENYFPDIRRASAELRTAMNSMALDTIAAATFGALSEAEMNFAIATSSPPDLSPVPLREWLIKKRRDQEAARVALERAAAYLARPGNTLEGFIDEQIKTREQNEASNRYISKPLNDLLDLAEKVANGTIQMGIQEKKELIEAIKQKQNSS
jgi:ferritin|tara:strand:- start:11269 stop:12738 length:1470 start_codon:yes stop_codon:yes gene_type:complete